MDVLFVLLAMGFLVAITFWVGLSYWGWFWISLAVLLATWEIIAKVRTGKTLSQQFGKLLRERRVVGLLLLGAYALAFAGLVLHLWAMR